jgi:hypothetical protein
MQSEPNTFIYAAELTLNELPILIDDELTINKEPSPIFHGRSMRTKNVVYFLSFLLISSAVTYCAGASQTNSVSFHGVGVTVYLSFPEEAHPLENIYHNLTITAYEYVNSLNITLFIYAPVNSTWQIIDQPHIILWPFPLGVNQSLPTVEINFTEHCTVVWTLKQTNRQITHPSRSTPLKFET